MNENAKKWVRALRSKKFIQGTGQLGLTDGAFCCLGVACEVYKAEHPGWNYDRRRLSLPEEVQHWLGLASSSGDCDVIIPRRGGTFASLADANDEEVTFAQIAKVIESEPAGLFFPESAR